MKERTGSHAPPTILSITNVESTPEGEKRWPMALVLIVAMILPFLLPDHPTYIPKWLFPALEGVLLVAVILADPGRIDRRSTAVRAISVGLVAILVLGAAGVTAHLIVEIIRGGPETDSAGRILLDGSVVWVYTIISFAFLYWEFDNGGPEARVVAPQEYPDLAFPQHLSPHLAKPGWRPQFFDYLYLSTTNATAFSPTDVMPLKHWAKLAMAAQSMVSLAILGLVIARAVNILR
jgi:hypothetical protein